MSAGQRYAGCCRSGRKPDEGNRAEDGFVLMQADQAQPEDHAISGHIRGEYIGVQVSERIHHAARDGQQNEIRDWPVLHSPIPLRDHIIVVGTSAANSGCKGRTLNRTRIICPYNF